LVKTVILKPNFFVVYIQNFDIITFLIFIGVIVTFFYQFSTVGLTSQTHSITSSALHQILLLPKILLYTLLKFLQIVPREWNLQVYDINSWTIIIV
jgi:hypothetical protein